MPVNGHAGPVPFQIGVVGISRVAETDKALLIALSHAPSDADMRSLYDHLRRWQTPPLRPATGS